MGEGNVEMPIGDQVDQWLRSRKPEPPKPQSEPQDSTKAVLNQVFDFLDREARAKAEVPERGRRLYLENPGFRETTDLYHDSLSILSSVPAFREAVIDTQYKYLQFWSTTNPSARERLDKLKRGEPVHVYEMLDEIFHHGVKTQFKVGDYFYDAYVSENFLRLERSSQPIQNELSIIQARKARIEKAAQDPTFRDELVLVRIDNGADTSDILMYNKPPRDYLNDNRSSIIYHDFKSDPDQLPEQKDASTPINPEDVTKAHVLLIELQKGLAEGKYEDTPDQNKRLERHVAFEKATRDYRHGKLDALMMDQDAFQRFQAANAERLPKIKIFRDQWKSLLSTIPEYKKALEAAALLAEKSERRIEKIQRVRTSFKRGNNYYLIEEATGLSLLHPGEMNFIRIRKSARGFPAEKEEYSYTDDANTDQEVTIDLEDTDYIPSCIGYYDSKERRDYKVDPINTQKDIDGLNSMFQSLKQDLATQVLQAL